MLRREPLVSICIPVHNGEMFVEQTINALLRQTYRNIEVVIVDDHSTDQTLNILKNIKDSRVRWFENKNSGAAAARNLAFLNCRGDFIKFMDADDIVNVECIEAQTSRLIETQDCIASAKWGRFYNNDVSTFFYSPEPVWKDMKSVDWLVDSLHSSGGNMMQPGIFLIPRQIIKKSGLWNEELSLIDDFEFMCRVMTNAEKVLFCPNAVLKYRSGNTCSLSGKKNENHMHSAYRSLELGLNKMLEVANTVKSKRAAANAFQRWAYQFYPDHFELFQRAEAKAKALGGATVKPEGGRKFKWLSKLVGWKMAKKLARPA